MQGIKPKFIRKSDGDCTVLIRNEVGGPNTQLRANLPSKCVGRLVAGVS